MSPSCTARR